MLYQIHEGKVTLGAETILHGICPKQKVFGISIWHVLNIVSNMLGILAIRRAGAHAKSVTA